MRTEIRDGVSFVFPKNSFAGETLREDVSDGDISVFLEQIKQNGWEKTNKNYLVDKEVVVLIDRSKKFPEYKEVSFKVFDKNEFGLLENELLLPGFLLSDDDKKSERVCDYVLSKHLWPANDKSKVINAGDFTYNVKKIIINNVKDNVADLTVEVGKNNFNQFRKGDVNYFINETRPVILGGNISKPVAEFIRMYTLTNYTSFVNKKLSDVDKNRRLAIKCLECLLQTSFNKEPPNRVYVDFVDKTGMFNKIIEIVDLDFVLFNTWARYAMKSFYESDFFGGHKEVQEFNKEKFLSDLNDGERLFYSDYLSGIREDFKNNAPLRLKVFSKIR